MALIIKPTERREIEAIFALRHDPDVLLHQYRPRRNETPESFARKLEAPPNPLGMSFRCTSILVDDVLVGHVMQHFGPAPDPRLNACECGWNLAKSHWGQGIMTEALTLLFAQLFEEDPKLLIFASCFTSNQRSRRVIEKLGFRRDQMHWFVWLTHFVRSRGRRIEQFRLDRRGYRLAQAHLAAVESLERESASD
ncbi:GNAT family N-acetyltransferase [Stieleria mannarensis]|uniref:GNAT family N-acetyltransferase n=1 Tax=Stieleria mannarensis TaxID=2755585 RepID=UPI0015FEEC0B